MENYRLTFPSQIIIPEMDNPPRRVRCRETTVSKKGKIMNKSHQSVVDGKNGACKNLSSKLLQQFS